MWMKSQILYCSKDNDILWDLTNFTMQLLTNVDLKCLCHNEVRRPIDNLF